MNEREKTIRLWFDMWLNQQDMVNPFLVLYNLVDIFNRRTYFNMVQ